MEPNSKLNKKKNDWNSRMSNLIAPLTDPKRLIFDVKRMVYGGFQALFQSNTGKIG